MKFKTGIIFFLLLAYSNIFSQAITDFLIPKELSENANAIVKESKEKLEIINSKKMVYQVSKKIIVLNEKGDEAAASYIYYNNERNIKTLEVKVYNLMGNEIKKIKKSDFKDVASQDGFSLQQDGRIKYADYTATTYPYLLHFTYSYETSDTAFLPRWTPFDDYLVSVENASMEVIYDPSVGFRKSEKNFEGYTIQKVETSNSIKYTLSNLQAQKREPYGLSPDEYFPKVFFALNHFSLKGYEGTASTWKELGEWFYEKLYKSQTELSPETVTKIKQLTANAVTDEEKARIVYQYVQDKTRYVSIQLGIGGWQPMLAKDVDRLGYGDCKALTNYTYSLLKAVGVTSYHTVIQNDIYKYDFDEDFPIIQGNHMILCIPTKDNIWVECTSQKNALGYIGRSNEDRKVLIVTPEGGQIVTTKKYLTKDNQQITKASGKLDSSGKLQVNMNRSFQGSQIDFRTHLESKTPREQEEYYRKVWDYYNSLKIKSYSTQRNQDKSTWEEQFDLEIEKYASVLGNRYLIPLNVFSRDVSIPDKTRNRKQPLKISRGYVDSDEIEIEIPDGFTIEALPEQVLIQNKFGSYEAKVTMKNNIMQYSRKIQINEGDYSKEDYLLYRDFMTEINKLDNSKASLIFK